MVVNERDVSNSGRGGISRTACWTAALAAILVLSAASSAAALTVVDTFSGTIVDGVDQAGIFGAAGTNLAGASFTAVVTTPITAGDSQVTATYALAAAILSPTISTVTFSITEASGPTESYFFPSTYLGGASDSLFIAAPNSGLTPNLADVPDPNSTYSAYVRQVIGIEGLGAGFSDTVELVGGGSFPLSFTTPGTYSVAQNPYPNDFFGIITGIKNFNATSYAQGDLDTTSLIVSVIGAPAPVAEPAAWALIIAGFSLTGAALRHRRAATPLHARTGCR